jgi:antitoxin FitA
MGNLLLRDVEDDVIQRLKTKARVNRTSLHHEAKSALKRGAPLTGEERRRILDGIKAELGAFPTVKTSGADIVREVREDEE